MALFKYYIHSTEDTYKVHTHVCIWSVGRPLIGTCPLGNYNHPSRCMAVLRATHWVGEMMEATEAVVASMTMSEDGCSFSTLVCIGSEMFSIIVPYRHLLISFYYTHIVLCMITASSSRLEVLTVIYWHLPIYIFILCALFRQPYKSGLNTAIKNLGKSRKEAF